MTRENLFKLEFKTALAIIGAVVAVVTAHLTGISTSKEYAKTYTDTAVSGVKAEAAAQINQLNIMMTQVQQDVSFIRGKMDK